MSGKAGEPSVVRVGIAGLGFGLEVHMPAFREIPGVTIVGLLGRDPARAADAAGRTGLPVVTDLEAWFDIGFDAVSLALPPERMATVAAAAIGRGLPVLCEKPLGRDLQSAITLAAQAAPRPSAIDFEFAELATFKMLHETIRAGEIGRVRHVATLWLMESRAHRDRQWSWKTDAAAHGGVISLMGAHTFFLLEWLFDPVERLLARLDATATARLAAPPGARPAEDLLQMMCEHRGGAVSSVVVGNANPGAAIHRWTIVGEAGTAVLENSTGSMTDGFALTVRGADGTTIRQAVEPAREGDGRIAPVRRLAVRFVEAVRSGGRCRPDFNDGARVAAIAEAARRSAQVEAWVAPDAVDRG